VEIVANIVREAINVGDLNLPMHTDEYQILFTLISTIFGDYVMRASNSPVMSKWFNQVRSSAGTFGQTVLDGWGWKPLSGEWNYAKTKERFFREVFPELLKDEFPKQ